MYRWQKILIALGAIFLVIIVIFIVAFSILAPKTLTSDREIRIYLNKVIPIILSNMNKETFLLYAADQLKNSAKPEELEKVFGWYSKLGKFKEKKGLSIQLFSITHHVSSGQILGRYIVNADFERGPAEVKVAVIKEGTDWKILEFFINSEAFID